MTTQTMLTKPPARPEVLRCTSSADFLAALPVLTGFTADDSLFVVFFRGKRGSDALRVDLPARDDTESALPLVEALINILRETGAGAEAPAIVITTTRSFTESKGAPWRSLTRQLLRRVHQERWSLREFSIVAADGWSALLSDDPDARRSLDEIASSQVTARARENRLPPRNLDELWELPQPDAMRSRAVARHLEEIERRALKTDDGGAASTGERSARVRMQGIARVAASCYEAAAGGTAEIEIDPRLLARLIDAAQQPDRWLVLALSALTRPELVTALTEENEAEFLSEIVVGPDIDPTQQKRWSVGHLLLSLSHDSPEPRRLRHAIAAIAHTAAHAPRPRRPGLLALLAWAWWMLGMQTCAQHILRDSLAIDAHHELTLMIGRLAQSPPSARLNQLKSLFAS